MALERYLCIHAHFYQPPRENPWLEAVEIQDSAFPYHNWNERVTAECYAPNTASRILDGEEKILDLVSNYGKISFNFGPTLLSWMETSAYEVYRALIDADRESISRHGGHGNAIAQAYNHIIMPLATTRDKRTQIIWGIEDFKYRFSRHPEGMWLPETAVDLETLDILSEMGIKFTILAPRQASKIKKIGAEDWIDVSNQRIDPTMAYLCPLPSGRQINIFFYDGPISRAIAFERVLDRGEDLVNRLLSGFSEQRNWPQILSIATDGETYGHHHKFGDMALAYALNYIELNKLARLTNFGEYLDKHPPSHEVSIFENTSWSCIHGIERWRSNCGCNTGGHPQWNQEWRTPLREVFDWLRDELAIQYERVGEKFLKDPWEARDEYVHVILNRSHESLERFFEEYGKKDLEKEDKTIVLKLLEMQRHSMLMYTSCGWFFDDLSGIETIQVIGYAARAIQLLRDITDNDLEGTFLEKLSSAKSNIPEIGNGASIYEKTVRPSIIDLEKVGIHYAVSSIFEDYPVNARVYCYSISRKDYHQRRAGDIQFAIGRIYERSEITLENEELNFCVIYFGNHNFYGGVHRFTSEEDYNSMKEDMLRTFESGGFAEILGLMGKYFGMERYSFKNLFRDEQRKIINLIIRSSLEEFYSSYRLIYESNRILMSFLKETNIPIPSQFFVAAEFTLNQRLKNALMEKQIDIHKVEEIIEEINRWNIPVNSEELEYLLKHKLESLMHILYNNPSDLSVMDRIYNVIKLLPSLPFGINMWNIQNIYFKLSRKTYPDFLARAEKGDPDADRWIHLFREIGKELSFNIKVILKRQLQE